MKIKRFDLVGYSESCVTFRMEEAEDGDYVYYSDYAAEIEKWKAACISGIDKISKLAGQIQHWKGNHDRLRDRLRLFIQREDLPVDRIPAYKKLLALEEENEKLRIKLAQYEDE